MVVSRNAHVGVLSQTVDFVEQLKQERMLAGVHAATFGDQVDVLDDHERRLQRPGDRDGRSDELQRVAGQHHDGRVGQAADQVAQRVCLARTRWTVQQHAALEVLATGHQPAAMASDAQHLGLDGLQHTAWEHQVLARQRGPLVKAERGVTRPEHL